MFPGSVCVRNYRFPAQRYGRQSAGSPKKDIIAFASENNYFIYGYEKNKGFYEKASIELKDYDYNTRGIYIGDFFYVCTSRGITSYDMEKDFVEVDSLEYR